MASSKPEIKKPGSGGSLLAPSKFGANFGRSDSKRLFTGLKASKLTSIAQSVCSSSTVSPTSQPQNSNTETASGTIVSSKPFGDPSKTLPSSSCTPLVSKVTLNTGTKLPDSSESKESADEPKDTSTFEIKPSENNKSETSSFVFGQNLADRAENFPESSGEEKNGSIENDESKKVSSEPSTGFVFGQNLAERASNIENDTEKNKNVSTDKNEKPPDALSEETKSKEEASDDNSSQVSSNIDPNPNENKQSSPSKDKNEIAAKNNEPTASLSCKTLNENAAEYLESHLAQSKRRYDEVEVITGEENEHNVLHLSGKLYLFHKPKGWLEKGRGELRLNDLSVAAANASSNTAGLSGNQASRDVKRKVLSSRIVMRTLGSLRVILNTKVYHGMSVEKPNEKSVRLTGMEDGVAKVFLITASPKDTNALHSALKSRLAELKSAQEEVDQLESQDKIVEKSNDTHDSERSNDEGVSSTKKSKIDV